MIDSKKVFSIVAKDAQTTVRRLQIDVVALRQIYDKGEILQIAWISGADNPADSLTKPVLSETSPLLNVMRTNRFDLHPAAERHLARSSFCFADSCPKWIHARNREQERAHNDRQSKRATEDKDEKRNEEDDERHQRRLGTE